MLLFKSFTISSINDAEETFEVNFHFEENGESVMVTEKLNYGNLMGFTAKVKKMVPKDIIDDNGVLQKRFVEKEFEETQFRKAFDMSNKELLGQQLKSYAIDYALGQEQVRKAKVVVSDEVQKMLGVKHE